ncbi:flagellar export chaperone FlgN [candidate division KSB1 bacterium]|nr:flagellar export chaperone FlgN [candidate division KSB1 bacterium]
MDALLQHFSDHLDTEYQFLISYLAALQKQTLSVVDGNTQGIIMQTSIINDMIRDNQEIQKQRQQLLTELAQQYQIVDHELTISLLIPHLDDIWAHKLNSQKELLINIVQKIQRETESNTYLLRYAIDFTHSIIQLSDRAIKNQLGYSRTGSKSLNNPHKKIFDHKA